MIEGKEISRKLVSDLEIVLTALSLLFFVFYNIRILKVKGEFGEGEETNQLSKNHYWILQKNKDMEASSVAEKF